MPAKARYWFDQRIAEAGAAGWTKATSEKSPFSPEEEATLKQLIVSRPAAHHEPDQSLGNAEMRSKIEELINARQQWILGDMREALGRSKVPQDGKISPDEFARNVQKVLDASGTEGNKAWKKLRDLLQKRCETEVLGRIRAAIAQEQAPGTHVL